MYKSVGDGSEAKLVVCLRRYPYETIRESLSKVNCHRLQEGHAIAIQKFFAFFLTRKKVGVFNVQGPPVPIPNTVVKLHCADNT